ncbi:MAG: sel1 repeat family protein [Desulfobacteraceae bacterium]|nr:sel1 repeat family protein [Desulfobacteraceae bacterium]
MPLKTKVSLLVLFLLIFPLAISLNATTIPDSLKQTEKFALRGDADAQYQMGMHYLKKANGVVGNIDFKKAEKWFRVAAEQGHTDGLFGLGFILNLNVTTLDNEIEVARLFKLASDKGHKTAQYELAMYILKGKANLKKDTHAAVNLLKKAAAQNNTKANVALVAMAHNNNCDLKTGKQSLNWLKRKAEKGNKYAQYEMGWIYENGYLTKQDFKQAKYWYTKSALQMLKNAHFKIGQLYESGNGVSVNYKKAKDFYENAIKLGHFSANWNIAQFYENGQGVKKSDEKAAKYYLEAAKYGHLKSMISYGKMSLEGIGVGQNNAISAKWFGKAAVLGDAEAQYSLGKMYTKGLIEVELQDTDKLNTWLKIVRGRFSDPRIRAQNREGEKWLKKAADQGHEGAIKHFRVKDTWMSWTILIVGLIFLPISIGLFKWPEIAENHNPIVIRYLSAPLTFLFSLFGIIYGFNILFLQ